MKMKDFSHCQNNAFPLTFLQQNKDFMKTDMFLCFVLDNFNGKNISLTTFIWFKEYGQTL